LLKNKITSAQIRAQQHITKKARIQISSSMQRRTQTRRTFSLTMEMH